VAALHKQAFADVMAGNTKLERTDEDSRTPVGLQIMNVSQLDADWIVPRVYDSVAVSESKMSIQ
jgi:hypothetical protein